MVSYDIDGFGVLETSALPGEPEIQVDPVLPDDRDMAHRFAPEDVPDSPDSTSQTTPEHPPADDEEPPPQHDFVEVVGSNNATARGDIDQSRGKTEVHGPAIYVGTEFVEHVARASTKKRNGRGIQDPEALHRRAKKYVPPANLLGQAQEGQPDTAWHILNRRRVLLLSAQQRDCGQFAAALRLSHELRKQHPDLIVREELMGPDLHFSPQELLVEHEPAAVLVDLRDSSENDLQNVHRGLVDLSNHLPRYASYLMLIIPPEQEHRFEDDFPGRVHRLEKPRSLDVFASHAGQAAAAELGNDTAAIEQLEDLWPPQVKAIADTVRERIDEGEESATALANALHHEASGEPDRFRTVIQLKQEEDDSEWLALLLAAALLERSSPQHIAAASDELRRHNNIGVHTDVAPLLRPSPHTRLLRLSNWFSLSTRELLPRGIGSDVLRHFWREHPDLREPMQHWLITLPGAIRSLTREELEQIADRAAELAAEGGAKLALVLAAGWAKTKTGHNSSGHRTSTNAADRSRRSVAVRLLTTAAMDSVLGREVRQQLWNWSRGGNADLKLLTAETCAGIGTSFPRNALTRLKHLAESDNADVRSSVVEALCQIEADLGISRFLRYLAAWFDGASATRLSVLSEAVSITFANRSENVDFDVARSFWYDALGTMPLEEVRPLITSWLRAAAELEPDARIDMLEALVQATGSNSLRIAHVQYASKFGPTPLDLSPFGDDPVTEVVHQLWARLDEIDPLWPQE